MSDIFLEMKVIILHINLLTKLTICLKERTHQQALHYVSLRGKPGVWGNTPEQIPQDLGGKPMAG